MKYITELVVILGFSLLGEIVKMAIPLPVPAGIYGLLLLFFALVFGVVKLGQVAHTGHYIIEIMIVMFIAPSVGLIKTWSVLSEVLVPYCVIVLLTTIAVMVVTGHVAQWLIRRREQE